MKKLLLVVSLSVTALVACSSKGETIIIGAPGPDAGTVAPDAGEQRAECTSARKSLLNPVAKASTGEVKVVSNENGVMTIYVDATAGGIDKARSNPRTYIKLDGTRVDITDEEAFTSSDWDLALKRVDLYTNGGDSGPGQGAGRLVRKDFAAVTAADAEGIAQERFFSGDCEPNLDEATFVVTSFTGWYDYTESNNIPRAKKGIAFVVKAADGTLHKVGILSNSGNPDGTTTSLATGRYLLQVSKL